MCTKFIFEKKPKRNPYTQRMHFSLVLSPLPTEEKKRILCYSDVPIAKIDISRLQDQDATCALCRFAAESLDSVSPDSNVKEGFGTFAHAVASLLSKDGVRVWIEEKVNRSKTIPLSPGEWSFFVSGDWSPFVLVNSSQCTLDANVGYNIRVTGVETHSNIVSPSHLKWTRIITTKRCSLHINSESIQSGLQVHLYRSGILWRSEEHASEHSLSLSFNVISQDSGMDSGMDSEFSWIPSFPDLMSTESANSFAYHLLRTMHIEAMSKSSIVNTMLQRCLPWRYMLSTRWIPTQHDIVSEIIELLNRKRMSDGFVKLIHSAVLMCRVDRDFSFDAVGLSLMQRIRHQKWRHSEHPRENTMSELSVIGFGVMQLQYSEFSRCYKLGVFQGVDNISEYGFVADGENGRLLVVPKDVNQLQIVMAISSLFPCDNPIEEEEILFLPFDTIHSEVSYSGCVHTMKMSPYRLSLSLDGITLTWDADTKCQTADKCISVDELQTGDDTNR